MLVVTIDFGTYSLKILESRVEKKKVKHINKFELKVSQEDVIKKSQDVHMKLSLAKEAKDRELTIDETLPYLEFQVKLLKDYLQKIPDSAKVFIQSPHQLTTSRFINIPIANKKKANLMLPFQIEEDIPYSLNQVELTHSLEKEGKSFNSVSSLIDKKTLSSYHQYFKEHDALPTYLGTETDCWNYYLKEVNELQESHILILDIGHTSTNAYFFANKKLTFYSQSSFAGHSINEMLMNEYKVEINKATDFKHKNAFYLTPEQYADVDEKQREFASKMNHATKPLITDFKRWELSLRVNHQKRIDKVYLCGGSSKIKNIENFLAQNFGHQVSFTKDWTNRFNSLALEKFDFLNFANANALSTFHAKRQVANNFFTGIFSPQRSDDFPLHSISFVSLRAFLLSLIIGLGFFTETFFLNQSNKKISKSLKATLSQPSLGLSKRERSAVNRRPDVVLRKIQQKTKKINKEISSITQASQNRSLIALFELTEKIETPCYLSQYLDSYDAQVEATFSGCESENIIELEKNLQKTKFEQMSIKANPNKGNLILKFQL